MTNHLISERSIRKSGFTLIELLVVIAIIAILASILFPVFGRARENARRSSCQSNLKQIGLGIAQYNSDFDGYYPIAWDTTGSWTRGANWMNYIQPYTKSLQVFQCPSDKGRVSWDESFNISYGINAISSGYPFRPVGAASVRVGDDGGGCWMYTSGNCTSLNESAVTQASTSILVGEKHGGQFEGFAGTGNKSATGMNAVFAAESSAWHGELNNYGKIPDGTRAPVSDRSNDDGPNGSASDPHFERANFLFLDGHVKSLRPLDTNPNPNTRPGDNMWNSTRE